MNIAHYTICMNSNVACVRKGKNIILFCFLVHFGKFVTKGGAESFKFK